MVATQLRASAANKLAPLIFLVRAQASFALLFLVVGGAILPLMQHPAHG